MFIYFFFILVCILFILRTEIISVILPHCFPVQHNNKTYGDDIGREKLSVHPKNGLEIFQFKLTLVFEAGEGRLEALVPQKDVDGMDIALLTRCGFAMCKLNRAQAPKLPESTNYS